MIVGAGTHAPPKGLNGNVKNVSDECSFSSSSSAAAVAGGWKALCRGVCEVLTYVLSSRPTCAARTQRNKCIGTASSSPDHYSRTST